MKEIESNRPAHGMTKEDDTLIASPEIGIFHETAEIFHPLVHLVGRFPEIVWCSTDVIVTDVAQRNERLLNYHSKPYVSKGRQNVT